MKIKKFNESVRNKNTQYKLYVFVGGDQGNRFGSPAAINNTYDTLKDTFDKLKSIVYNGLPGGDGNTYHIYDAYIEKISIVKTAEVKSIINSKKYNI